MERWHQPRCRVRVSGRVIWSIYEAFDSTGGVCASGVVAEFVAELVAVLVSMVTGSDSSAWPGVVVV